MSHDPLSSSPPWKKWVPIFSERRGDWLEFHLKFWYMAFSNLGSHNVLGPSWHWVALTKFCASKSLGFKEFLDTLTACLRFWSFILFVRCTRLPSFFSLLSCHQPFLLGGHVLGKRPHDLSGSTQCLRHPASFACTPQTISLILFTAANLSLVDEIVFISL